MHINVSQTLQYHQQETCFLDLELAIDPPFPRGSFVHYGFLKLHYIRNKMTNVSSLYVGALTSITLPKISYSGKR